MIKSSTSLHVLFIASSGVFFVSGYVDLMALGNWNVCISDCVTCANLRAFLLDMLAPSTALLYRDCVSYCIKSNGQRTAGHLALGLSRMVDDRLVVLVCPVGEVHAYDIEPSFT